MTTITCAHPSCSTVPAPGRRKVAGSDSRFCAAHQPATASTSGAAAKVYPGVPMTPTMVYKSLPSGLRDFLDNCKHGNGYPVGGRGGIHPRTADGLVARGLATVEYHGGARTVWMSAYGRGVAQEVPGTEEHDYARMAAAEAELKESIAAIGSDGLGGAAPEFAIEQDDRWGNFVGSLTTQDGTQVRYESDSYEETLAVMRAEAFLEGQEVDSESGAEWYTDAMYAAAYRLSAMRHVADANRSRDPQEQQASLAHAESLRDAVKDYYDCDSCGFVTLHEFDTCTSCGEES